MDKTVKAEGISCIMHTCNSQATLEAALWSVTWVDELIIVDMGSADATLTIARKYTDRIFSTNKVPRVDGIRNDYLEKAENQWVLVLDSDEYLAADARDTIKKLIAEYGAHYDAFAIPRYNYIAGQIMRGSGWYPDHQIRLFRKGTVQWTDGIHISPRIISGHDRLMTLTPPSCLHIHHRNYEDLSHFITKQVTYAVNDHYDTNPETFHFDDYIACAYESLAFRRDPERDGDLSRALALIMAWDAIIRGLIHWDRLQPRPPLNDLVALPIKSGPDNRETYRSSFFTVLQRALKKWKQRGFKVVLRTIRIGRYKSS